VSLAPPEASSPQRLAWSQVRRIRRIVDAAVQLAEQGGFDGVRLRDVADASGVALGTLYKYFHSKEDILLFAANEGNERLLAVLAERPPEGATATERVADLFARATRGLTRRPHFARAVVRAIAASDSATAVQQAAFHLRMSRVVVAALRGERPDVATPLEGRGGTEHEQRIALVLENVWFSSLLGWASGLHSVRTVNERMRETAELILERAGP
jgi:AcrR family transcriptional regulator